jgi:uncharacterized membrane protein
MGRSSGGGGGHSSGGFGGGHSSGGFSGGGRSFGGGFSGGPSHGPGGGGHMHGGGPRWYGWGPMYYGGPGISYTIIMIIAIIVLSIMSSSMTQNTKTVIKNTTQREKLVGVVNKTDWYDDQIGWVNAQRSLTVGLEEFYKSTGIQPYVMFIPYSAEYWNGSNINATAADKYLEEVYSSKFTDEGHFIFAYFACANDSKSEMDGEFRYLSGYSADTIMDSEAIQILWGYFEIYYYDTSLSMETMISRTFVKTGEAIMSKPTNGWDIIKVLIIIVGIVIVVIVVYKIIKNKNKREKEKEEYTKEILSKPLETFGKDTSDLENKYK